MALFDQFHIYPPAWYSSISSKGQVFPTSLPGVRGWSLKGQRKKGKRDLNCTPSKLRPHEPILLLLNSILFNYSRYFFTRAFFDLIELLKDYYLDLYLYLIF